MPRPHTADPMRSGLVLELRAIRRGRGSYEERLAQLPWLIDCLGHGQLERAAGRLQELRRQFGADAESPVGAFFWLGDVGLTSDASLEKRQELYGETFACDPRTAIRRSDAGIDILAATARDFSEGGRPVGMLWLFQGAKATAVIDFWMASESYREPEITVNDEPVSAAFAVNHRDTSTWGDRQRSRLILEGLPIVLPSEAYEPALTVRALWEMPIWPVWQVTGWIADTRFAIRLQTFRERAAEVSLILRPEGVGE